METATQNLWPDFRPEKTKTPKSILKEQAGYLMEKTNNILSAEVRTRSTGEQIQQSFYVVAPALHNYRYELLSITHGTLHYPLVVSFQVNGTTLEQKIENEQEFVKSIADIFNNRHTVSIISSLISQSLEE